MKVAFFDTKPYDVPGFDHYAAGAGLEIKYFETRLNADTVSLASGFDAVCVFVNDTVDSAVVEKLYEMGVKVIALRCAGFNNVDIRAASGKLPVYRVPAYSPYAVAEHAMALLLTINRRTHKAYIRTRDFNFSLQGLAGFDLHGKTVGIIGTGKIGRVFADICKGFGMNILAYDKFPAANSGLHYVDLPELFAKSDILSLHCPLTEETRHINKWLADNCFGDYYTRGGLSTREREMITLCFLAAQGGCEPQLTSHAKANMGVGNEKAFLIAVISQCMPYIGYPRTLNAIRCINDAAEQMQG